MEAMDLEHRNETLKSPSQSTHLRPNTNTSNSIRVSSTAERHTLPEIPRNPLTATVAHVVSRELGENFLKAPIRPETVKKLVVSGNVDDVSHRLYVQHLREIQAKREYQLQKIGHDEQAFLLAEIQAHESAETEEKSLLSSLYVDEQTLTRDQVILPRDFLNYNLQRYIKGSGKEEASGKDIPVASASEAEEKERLPKLTSSKQKRTSKTIWKDQLSVPDRDFARARLQMIDNLTNYPPNPRFDEYRQNQLINTIPTQRPPSLLPVFEAIPPEIVFTRYRVGDVHETTLLLRNLSSVAHSCRVIPPRTPYFCISLSQYPSGQSLVATGLSVVYNIKFAPDTLGVFEDEIIVQCSNGTEFSVKLLAKRPPPLLTLPSVVDCGYWLVGGRKMCEFKVRNDGGEGRFALVSAAAWPAVNFKTVVRNETVLIPPFELAPSTLDLRPGDTFPLQVSFTPQTSGEFLEEFMMICDNGEVARFKLKGVAQTIQVRFEDIEGGVIDLNELEVRDISAQYSINFITINPFSYCQKKMTIKNLTNIELPYAWALLEPVLYTRDDFAKQTQPIEIERIVSESSPFHIEPNRGTFPPLATVEFRLIFAPSQIGSFHTVFHLIVPNAPVYPTPAPSPNLVGSPSVPNTERAHSPEMIPRPISKLPPIPSASLRTADYTVLRFETRGICENFKYIFDPFAVIFMDKLYKNLAYRKDFQLTNTSISPLIINWSNWIDQEIIHVEPVMAEIPADTTVQFTLIFTGTKIGPSKVELPFKLDGIDDFGYFHVEADVIGPDVDVDPTTLDFGLVEYGEMVEKFLEIKNSSPIVATCHIEERHKENIKSHLSLPDGTELTLKPIELYRMPIRLTAEDEGVHLSYLEVHVDDGKIIPVEINAIIQRPSAYVSPVELDVGETFLQVPVTHEFKLHPINQLPTHFQWGEPISTHSDACFIDIQPRAGTLYNGQPLNLKLTFLAQQCGDLDDDFHVPCYIHNAAQPIFLRLKATMKGMNIDFRHNDNTFQLNEEFTLDFDRVPLGEKSSLELVIRNLTDMPSGVRAKIAKFKTKSLTPAHGQKATNFVPSDLEMGIGFHLEQAEDEVYPLPPRGTAVIPLSVLSSMWGHYKDTLQLEIEGIETIKEIPVQVQITGNPIKTYLNANPNNKTTSLPVVQFGSMLHNSVPMVKKVHMQNISHVPIRIDWIVYDIEEQVPEQPKLIELIPVVDNNPFDPIESEVILNESHDEFMSQTTASTKTSFPSSSPASPRSSETPSDQKSSPLIKLFLKPYRGQRASPSHAVYTTTSTQKIIQPREHFYLDITIHPRHCPVKDRPIKCNARIVGVLSVSADRQGSTDMGYYRPIYYEHEENIEFEVHASLEMPSLRIELNDDDCDVERADGLCFAIPVGDILSCRPNLYDCTFPLTKSSSRSSAKSSTLSSERRHERIYTQTLNLLNTRQCTIPFELSISDKSFLSFGPTSVTTLVPQAKANVQCHFHLTQDLIDRFHTYNLEKDSSLSSRIEQKITAEQGRRVRWREYLAVKFTQNEMEQVIPIDIRLYYPILIVNADRIDFGTCFVDQTRQREFLLKNLTCSSSAWSIRKVHANMPEAYEVFRIEPKSGILSTDLNFKERTVQQVISVYFTARHNQTYECQLMVEGLLGEPPIPIFLSGEGSYDGKYEAVLDV